MRTNDLQIKVGTKGIVYKILALQIPSIFNKYLEKCETKRWRSGKHLHQVAPRVLHPPMLQTPNTKKLFFNINPKWTWFGLVTNNQLHLNVYCTNSCDNWKSFPIALHRIQLFLYMVPTIGIKHQYLQITKKSMSHIQTHKWMSTNLTKTFSQPV
jgi:hypothetical protein